MPTVHQIVPVTSVDVSCFNSYYITNLPVLICPIGLSVLPVSPVWGLLSWSARDCAYSTKTCEALIPKTKEIDSPTICTGFTQVMKFEAYPVTAPGF
jgi:hypothetical protein